MNELLHISNLTHTHTHTQRNDSRSYRHVRFRLAHRDQRQPSGNFRVHSRMVRMWTGKVISWSIANRLIKKHPWISYLLLVVIKDDALRSSPKSMLRRWSSLASTWEKNSTCAWWRPAWTRRSPRCRAFTSTTRARVWTQWPTGRVDACVSSSTAMRSSRRAGRRRRRSPFRAYSLVESLGSRAYETCPNSSTSAPSLSSLWLKSWLPFVFVFSVKKWKWLIIKKIWFSYFTQKCRMHLC